MSTPLFYYTLIVLLLMILSGSILLSTYIISRKKTFLIGFLICITYFFDMALIFRTSIKNFNNVISNNAKLFTITSPIESIFYATLLVAGLWLLFTELINLPRKIPIIISTIFAATSGATYYLITDPKIREFWFFTTRTIGFISLFIFAAIFYTFKANKIQRLILRKHHVFFRTMIILIIGQFIWNIYTIIILNGNIVFFGKTHVLPENNFIENITFLFLAFYLAWRSFEILKVHFDNSPQNLSDNQLLFIKEEAFLYSKKYSLSPREQEVLMLLIQDLSNQEIANILFINQTTVKVHVHNIFKKTGLSNRKEVVADFWHNL